MNEAELAYYAEPGLMTALDVTPEGLIGLPSDPASLCRVVQGLILHDSWAALYGVDIEPTRLTELETRPASAMVEVIQRLDPRPLAKPRAPELRMVGCCRHFSVLSCALLRNSGIPARARGGFATYFEPGRYIDHWLVEYWDRAGSRWIQADSQLDEAQQKVLSLDFDPLDVPAGRFLTGGEAWRLCRAGKAEPDRFGISDVWGLRIVRTSAIRDLAALNKVELLPWDGWGLMDRVAELGEEAADALVDELAAVTTTGSWVEVRSLYDNDLFRVPPTITSYRAGVRVNVTA